MTITRILSYAELRLLNRLVLDPSQRKISLAENLGITRSAVNQTWDRLEDAHDLRVRSLVNYGKIGLIPLMGLVSTNDGPMKLQKLQDWLSGHEFVTSISKSVLTASMESVLLFEVLLPLGSSFSEFRSKISKFERSFSAKLITSPLQYQGIRFNLGRFNGTSWDITDFFRLEAIISATKSFADILPEDFLSSISPPIQNQFEQMIITAALEKNYFATTKDVLSFFNRFDCTPPSGRTIRRRMKEIRERLLTPYVSITGLNLTQKVALVISASSTSDVVKALITQSLSFPKIRVVSGGSISVIYIDLPASVDWFAISTTISVLDPSGSVISPFILGEGSIRKGLEGVIPHLIRSYNE